MEKPFDLVQKIGVISDTHGQLAEAVISFLRSVDLILHAGDIDTPEILETLSSVGRTLAVRGNMDWGAWAQKLNPVELIEVGKHSIYMIHDLDRLDLDPSVAGVQLVLSGHTHRASHAQRNGVTYLNPGSASYPRYGQPATVGLIRLDGPSLASKILTV